MMVDLRTLLSQELMLDPSIYHSHRVSWHGTQRKQVQRPIPKRLEKKKNNGPTAVTASDIGYLDWKTTNFPIEKLLNGVTLPERVEAGKRELYLSDSEFEKLFKVKKDAWLAQPAWKRDQEKKKNKLF